MTRGVLPILAASLAAAAFAGPTEKYTETTSHFRQMICDPFGITFDGSWGFPRGTAWQVATGLDVDDFVNDEMFWSYSALHVTGPHNEIGGTPYVGVFLVDADDYGQKNGHTINSSASYRHEAHWDKFAARLVFDTTSNFGSDQITSYSYILMGVHTTSNSTVINVDSSLVSTNIVPPGSTPSVGNMLAQYTPASGSTSLTVVATSLETNQILGMSLNFGPAGQNGQFLAFLGTAGDWSPMGQGAASLALDDLQLPPQLNQALLQGLLYVKIHTISNPDGEIRGQLHWLRDPSRT